MFGFSSLNFPSPCKLSPQPTSLKSFSRVRAKRHPQEAKNLLPVHHILHPLELHGAGLFIMDNIRDLVGYTVAFLSSGIKSYSHSFSVISGFLAGAFQRLDVVAFLLSSSVRRNMPLRFAYKACNLDIMFLVFLPGEGTLRP
ncbi:hypothetical protein OIU76_013025 [Salix suchowensis]|nr:hypothetical protein OIU76_013025 [Salix suchowensis]